MHRSLSKLPYPVIFAALLTAAAGAWAAEPVKRDERPKLPLVAGAEAQPLKAQTARVVQALELLGNPLPAEQQAALGKALAAQDPAQSVEQIQAVLDPLCLVGVHINPESRVKVASGPAPLKLVEQGWRVFLVKVHNEAGVTAPLGVSSPNAEAVYKRSSNKPNAVAAISPQELADRWLDLGLYDQQPLNKELSGLSLEYRIIQLFSRDRGRREAKLMFDVGQGTQDLGFRNEVNLLFTCEPAVKVTLNVLDDDGQPTIGQFVFRDAQGRVYPSRVKRLAPDLFFHDQVYRASGESVMLPPGEYEATYTRGPEYRILKRKLTVPAAETHKEDFRLQRWIKLADLGWYSGDHHVHGAGCAHYEAPTEGVGPADMVRHIIGEDLNVGCVLSWGPCWYFQKKFFEGEVNRLSKPHNLMRYDVEVSGFPSSHAGHLCLLRLKEDDYPGTSKIEEWPSWDLPVLKWGQEQGGVVGFSHSGWGLQVESTSLPNHEMPKFDGIGANEYIVDVTHGVCDFISAVDTPIVWELNIWYQTLNCGYTCRISGETDFPCIYGERVGLGRAYVKMNAGDAPLDYDEWVYGIRDGRSYCTDGLSHLVDFEIEAGDEELGVGEQGADGRASVMKLKPGEKLKATVRAAAMLEETPREDIRSKPLDQKPYWHVERARIADTRNVPVELIVNGESVDTQELEADGDLNDLEFEFEPTESCWVALRIFPSSHTNPIFVEVDGKPIRASKKSAQWCLDAVDVCWEHKQRAIRDSERPAAERAFEESRQAYRKILAESPAD
ncbi:MAG TPA: CehA/McbA family metallohydrolase [Pirellulales bacterium]|nr:CehA/McbA family metallohydrolase [Pirellulales bacterium]